MKILYVLDSLAVGGAERSLLAIGRRLREAEPVMCHLHAADDLREAYEAASIRVISLGLTTDKAFLEGARRLRRVIRQERPDLIHSTLYGAGITSRLASWGPRRPRLLHTWVNEPPAHGHPANRPRIWRKRAAQLLDAVTSRRVDHFLANSRAIAESHRRAYRIAPERVTVIPRGRDPVPYEKVDPNTVAAVRQELELSTEHPVVLDVARLWHWKGQSDLVEAWPRVLRDLPDARLVLVGEGPDRPRLEHLVRTLGLGERVRFAGHRDDVPALLALADVFAFPSRYEGLPGAVVEALFAGLPVVLSDIPVHRETVDDGVSGILVPAGDGAAWAAVLVDLLREPERAARMGDAGRHRAYERFHVDDVARRHEDVYRRVLNR